MAESLGTEREARIQWKHALPRGRPVVRHDLLVDFARGKRVAHVGFVDELMESKRAQGVWLHDRLGEVASSLVGVDVDEDGVRWAREHGYDAYSVDAQSPEAVRALGVEPAEVVIAGEIVEHLDAPGPFLRAMRELARDDGLLVVTTPNAYRLLNFLAPLRGSELVHPDHTLWSSPQTLRELLRRGGWEVEGMAWYENAPRAGASIGNAARRALLLVGRIAPYWSTGIAAWARPSSTK